MADDAAVPLVATPRRVSLFITCFNDTMFPQTGRAVVSLLERLGVDVDFPLEQTCCGQMHFNAGYADETIPLVRRFVDVFGDSELIVSPSASCVGMVRHHYARVAELAGDAGLAREVAALAPRVLELTELLVDRLGVDDVGAFFPRRVTYHPTCHSLRMLHLGDRPLRLLRAVRGIEVVDLPEAAECCGFGGTFSVKNADTSIAMVSDKVRTILNTGAEVCASADNSCLMHIGGALSRQRAGVRTMHIAAILAQTEPLRAARP
jgi:L-lactate dehydrogenase complex protein LldE